MIDFLFNLEQKEYPYYDVIEIEIISNINGLVKYRTLICSKIDSKWRKWEPVSEINLPDFIIENRDFRINSILS